jgi:hypothetical protein
LYSIEDRIGAFSLISSKKGIPGTACCAAS